MLLFFIIFEKAPRTSIKEEAGPVGFEPTICTRGFEKKFDQKAIEEIMSRFRQHLEIDLLRAPRTVDTHVRNAREFLEFVAKPPELITADDVRSYLAQHRHRHPNTYMHRLKAVRVFLRYIGKEEIGKMFKFPRLEPPFQEAPKDDELAKFYQALESLHDKAFFLVLATSGLRYSEAKSLRVEDIDLDTGMVVPHRNEVRTIGTKNTGMTFINGEALEVLKQYLKESGKNSGQIFDELRGKSGTWYRWKIAREKSGTKIRPKDLRLWFNVKMALAGVPDRYVDFFCGRARRTIIARHYSEYSPGILKEIYNRAGLRVLG
ncbi:MAG: tyrosine-type recombinase/integrase [Candidatus Hadarchaeum sp.]